MIFRSIVGLLAYRKRRAETAHPGASLSGPEIIPPENRQTQEKRLLTVMVQADIMTAS